VEIGFKSLSGQNLNAVAWGMNLLTRKQRAKLKDQLIRAKRRLAEYI
jgi:hypothetical protein